MKRKRKCKKKKHFEGTFRWKLYVVPTRAQIIAKPVLQVNDGKERSLLVKSEFYVFWNEQLKHTQQQQKKPSPLYFKFGPLLWQFMKRQFVIALFKYLTLRFLKGSWVVLVHQQHYLHSIIYRVVVPISSTKSSLYIHF